MSEFLSRYGVLLLNGTLESLYMTLVPTLLAYVIGLPLGVLLTVTKPGGFMETPQFNAAFGWLVNIFRSIPFMILMLFLTPFANGPEHCTIGRIVQRQFPVKQVHIRNRLCRLFHGAVQHGVQIEVHLTAANGHQGRAGAVPHPLERRVRHLIPLLLRAEIEHRANAQLCKPRLVLRVLNQGQSARAVKAPIADDPAPQGRIAAQLAEIVCKYKGKRRTRGLFLHKSSLSFHNKGNAGQAPSVRTPALHSSIFSFQFQQGFCALAAPAGKSCYTEYPARPVSSSSFCLIRPIR